MEAMKRIKVVMRGWLNYYRIADMKNNIEALNGWQAVQANPDVYLEAVETVKDA